MHPRKPEVSCIQELGHGSQPDSLCWTWVSLHKGCARLPTPLHWSSPSGYYILSFSCIFIAINLGSNLAQSFSGLDYPCNVAMSRIDVCAGQLLVKMGCHTFYCSFGWIQPVLVFSVKSQSLKKPQTKLINNVQQVAGKNQSRGASWPGSPENER